MPTSTEFPEVQALMRQGAQVVEVLPSDEYADEYLPGAINIPLKQLDRQTTQALQLDRPIVVYCHDFAFQPSLSASRIRELAELGFLTKADNVVLVGRPGVEKTHLAIGLVLRACQARKRVVFTHAPALLNQLLAAEVSHGLGKQIEGFGRLDLLVVDELGYMPMDAHRANLLFQLISHLYTRTSVIVTSNRTFDQWGTIFGGDEVIASAILDRLLHHSHVFLIDGPSYRM